ncbi:MAG: hypothetical protein HYU66_03335 [Armatimonadetes bacterium]|nr:hypothetical protein [Armatimonadota bacterium]
MAETIHLAVVGSGRGVDACLNGLKTLWDYDVCEARVVAVAAPEAALHRLRGEGPPPPDGRPFDPPHLYLSDFQEHPLPALHASPEALVAEESLGLQGVLLCLPPPERDAVAVALLQRGLHVWLDPPLPASESPWPLVEAAATARLGGAVPARCRPLLRMARWCLEQGVLGELSLFARVAAGSRHRGGALAELDERGGGIVRVTAVEAAETLTVQLQLGCGALGQCTLAPHGPALPLTVYGSAGTLQSGRLRYAGGGEESLVRGFRRRVSPADSAQTFPHGVEDGYALALHGWLADIGRGEVGCESAAQHDVVLAESVAASVAGGGRPVRLAEAPA